MKLILIATIFCISLFGCKSRGSSSAYESHLDCQIASTKKYLDDRNACSRSSTRFEQSKCMSFSYRKYAAANCSEQMSVSLNSLSLMYKQLAEVDDPANSKFYPPAKREKIYSEIMQLIKEEEVISVQAGNRDVSNRKAAYYEARANRNLDMAMSILGAQQQNMSNTYPSLNSNHTYILNGKMINCMTTGSMTTCN